MKKTSFQYLTIGLLSMLAAAVVRAGGEEALAKKSQNPVADMISLPIKNKFNFDRGEEDAFAFELELQPVVPVHLGEWNLINRFIIPVAYQEPAYEGLNYEFGLKNITYQAFFSPKEPGSIIWGLGPAIIMPTNTANSLDNDKWAAGPAAVALAIRGKWVGGVLAQHFWDFAGDDDAADVDLSSLQYFINYNTPDYYISTSPTVTYNWEADSDEAWTIPVGGGIGKVMRFGETPVDMRMSAYWNAEAPESAPDWFAEFQVKLLFPK